MFNYVEKKQSATVLFMIKEGSNMSKSQSTLWVMKGWSDMKKGKFVINFLVVFILIAVGVISYRALEKKNWC